MNITERTKLRVSGADLRPMATEIVTKEIAKGSNMKVFNILRGAGRKVKVLQDRDAANKQQLRVQIEGVKMKFSSIREKTKWKIGDGRPRNGARIENERFWNLPMDSLKYIRKDAHDAMKANPNGRKAGKYADEVNDAETVMAWRKKNGIRESVELDEALKITHVVIDTADGNKIVSSATNEKQAKYSIVSAERPPMNIKDKKTLKVVQLKKPVSLNKDIIGTVFKESVDEAKTGLPTGQSTVDYENSIQKLMKTLKKDPKNKGKSGNELRKLATLKLTGHKLKEVRKPVSQMTPAEKAADAKKRKEYNAYQKSKRNESVELDEAIDFFKVSKELSDYAKKHGGPDKREFEKAAAYVREIGKNSAVSVQDKAGKGLNMLFKNADTDVRDRMQMILTKGGFKVKGGYVMRESIEEYKKENPMVMNLKGKKVELLKTGSSFKPTFTLTVKR
jgi:hypothetical protein